MYHSYDGKVQVIRPQSSGLFSYWWGHDPNQFRRAVFLILRGFIDESYKESGHFTLSVLFASGLTWGYFEAKWRREIARKNRNLRSQGRPQISRFHSSDFSNRCGEFAGWTPEEQAEFMKAMLEAFRAHKRGSFINLAYSLPLPVLRAVFPENTPDLDSALAACYSVLLKFLMIEFSDQYSEASRKGQIKPVEVNLFHDRNPYDAVLLKAFNAMLADESFAGREQFKSITPVAWQDSIALQAADLFSYEAFKEADRIANVLSRQQRKSMASLLGMDSIGGRTCRLDESILRRLRSALLKGAA